MYQIASEALIVGVEKFDPDLDKRKRQLVFARAGQAALSADGTANVLFTAERNANAIKTAAPTVTGIIKNYFRDYSRTVRLPRRIYATAARVRQESEDFI